MLTKTCQDLNWDDLAEKKVQPPFRPHINGELDVSNFADEFTNLPPAESPAAVPNTADARVFRVSHQGWISRLVLS